MDQVYFAYPANPRHLVINRLKFEVQKEKTVAIVGQSGCGKSTILQLLQRFYDTIDGRIVSLKYKIMKLSLLSLLIDILKTTFMSKKNRCYRWKIKQIYGTS